MANSTTVSLLESPQIELSCKAPPLFVIKMERYNLFDESFLVYNEEGVSVRGPHDRCGIFTDVELVQ